MIMRIREFVALCFCIASPSLIKIQELSCSISIHIYIMTGNCQKFSSKAVPYFEALYKNKQSHIIPIDRVVIIFTNNFIIVGG